MGCAEECGSSPVRQSVTSFPYFRALLVASIDVNAQGCMQRQYCRGPLLCAGSLQHLGCVEAAATCTPLARTLHPWQAELGIRSSDMVSVKFVDEISVVGMLLQLAPTLLLIGATYWCAQRAVVGAGMERSTAVLGRQQGRGDRRGREGRGLGVVAQQGRGQLWRAMVWGAPRAVGSHLLSNARWRAGSRCLGQGRYCRRASNV